MTTFFRLLPSAHLPGPRGGRWSWRALLAARAGEPDPATEATLITHRAAAEQLPIADGLARIRERIATQQQQQRRWWWPW